MQDKFSGAITLGYASIFVSAWLFFMPFAGWISFGSLASALPILMILGGAVLAIAGIFAFLADAKIESVLFFVMAALNFSFSLRFVMMPNLQANQGYSAVDGWIMLLVAVVFFYLWLASLKNSKIRQYFLLALWLAVFVGAFSNWFSSDVSAYEG